VSGRVEDQREGECRGKRGRYVREREEGKRAGRQIAEKEDKRKSSRGRTKKPTSPSSQQSPCLAAMNRAQSQAAQSCSLGAGSLCSVLLNCSLVLRPDWS
jgi:hypothetical protein